MVTTSNLARAKNAAKVGKPEDAQGRCTSLSCGRDALQPSLQVHPSRYLPRLRKGQVCAFEAFESHSMVTHSFVSHSFTSLSYEPLTNSPVSTGYQATPATNVTHAQSTTARAVRTCAKHTMSIYTVPLKTDTTHAAATSCTPMVMQSALNRHCLHHMCGFVSHMHMCVAPCRVSNENQPPMLQDSRRERKVTIEKYTVAHQTRGTSVRPAALVFCSTVGVSPAGSCACYCQQAAVHVCRRLLGTRLLRLLETRARVTSI